MSSSMNRTMLISPCLERSQEIQHVLLLRGAQAVESLHDRVRLAAGALMRLNGGEQIAGSSVMQEEHALTQSPERCRTKLIGTCRALGDSVGQCLAHVMHQQVGVQV